MIRITQEESKVLAKELRWFSDFGARYPKGLSSLNMPKAGNLHFFSFKRFNRLPDLPRGAYLVIDESRDLRQDWIVAIAQNPRLEIAKLTRILHDKRRRSVKYKNVKGAYIADSAHIGSDCYIEPGAFIGDNVVLAKRCEVYANAVLHAGVRAETKCRFLPGSVIGAYGFGYGLSEKEPSLQIAHLGGVELGPEVDVGAGTFISSGTIDPTVVGSGTKLDAHVYVGHNVRIGNGCMIATGSVVGGSSKIGNGVWLHPGAQIKTKIDIGDNAVIGMGAVVMKGVADGETVMGDVAGEIRKRLKREAGIDALLRERVR
ncbi:MAG: hypothetical protein JW800_05405 [Candidatus Omnitrophica bacterium]|nr:hypothetical protein [Candidatus Omnitrophota bacterium]